MLRALITTVLCLVLEVASAETLVFGAKAGEFRAYPIGNPADKVSFSAAFKLTAFDSSAAWPAAAYVGFFEGPNRNESFQFLVIKNGGNASSLTVGYRLIEGGKEKLVTSLRNIALDDSASVDLSFDKGIVTVKFDNQAPIAVKTRMTRATPYASVSSGSAEFKIRGP